MAILTIMKKVLVVTNMYPSEESPFSGIFIQEQLMELKKHYQFDFKIFLIDGIRKGKSEYIKSIFLIPKAIKSYKPDIIHIHYGISGIFLKFFKPKNVKIIVTLHGGDILEKGSTALQIFFTKKVIKLADYIFVQNEEMKILAEKINPNVEIMTCGIDPDFFKPVKPRITTDSKRILFPSSPERWDKNYQLFEKVIKILKDRGFDKIEIDTLDKLSREQVREKMCDSDVLLMTSVSEGSPQSIKEALSCGLPVVSVPVGDVAEMIEGIPNCYVAGNHDGYELADLVEKSIFGNPKGIREKFMLKENYFNKNIAIRLAKQYNIK